MNSSTENAMVQVGTLFPSGEPDRDKLNLISGTTIPQFCDFFWETSLRDKELVTKLRVIMQTMLASPAYMPPCDNSMFAIAPPRLIASTVRERQGRICGSSIATWRSWLRPVAVSTILSPSVTTAAPPAAFRP